MNLFVHTLGFSQFRLRNQQECSVRLCSHWWRSIRAMTGTSGTRSRARLGSGQACRAWASLWAMRCLKRSRRVNRNSIQMCSLCSHTDGRIRTATAQDVPLLMGYLSSAESLCTSGLIWNKGKKGTGRTPVLHVHPPQHLAISWSGKMRSLVVPEPQGISGNRSNEQVPRVLEHHPELNRHSFVIHMYSLALGKENTLCCLQEHVFRASEG